MVTVPNRQLVVGADNKPWWNQPANRRYGFQHLDRVARYSLTLRSARVMTLEPQHDLRIAQLDSVRLLTSLPWFSAMVVIRDQQILFERYATDFAPHQPHSIQSITKMTMNLVVGRLVEDGVIDPARRVGAYLPEIGSGYRSATVQQVLDMDVANDYREDYHDPFLSLIHI